MRRLDIIVRLANPDDADQYVEVTYGKAVVETMTPEAAAKIFSGLAKVYEEAVSVVKAE